MKIGTIWLAKLIGVDSLNFSTATASELERPCAVLAVIVACPSCKGTTKPPGSGTGLGLPLARAIVYQHGGVLEIRDRNNTPGHAQQVFVVELPADSRRDHTIGAV